jgi:hypothetical protein
VRSVPGKCNGKGTKTLSGSKNTECPAWRGHASFLPCVTAARFTHHWAFVLFPVRGPPWRLQRACRQRVASATRANPAAERRSAGGCDVATARARHSLKLCAANSTVSAIPVLFPLGSVCTWLSRAHGTYVAFSSFLSTFLSCARGGWARRRTS